MIEDICDWLRSGFQFSSCIYVLFAIPFALTVFVNTPPVFSSSNNANNNNNNQAHGSAAEQLAKSGIIVQEFLAYRLQQFDLAGNLKGSRAWRISFDATSLNSNVFLRRCLIVSWETLLQQQVPSLPPGSSKLHELLPNTLGALLILIPSDLTSLTAKEQNDFLQLEQLLLEKPFNFAVYLLHETDQLKYVLENVEHRQNKQGKETALSTLVSMVTANSYHFVSEIQTSNILLSNPIYNVVGKLSRFDRSDKVPTILLVAHYDSFGSAPALSFGADSNGSGAAALLEILRLFSKFYANTHSRARYNLIFLLSGAGKFNFMGSRQFIDDYMDQIEASNTPLSKIEFALCLDSLLSNNGYNNEEEEQQQQQQQDASMYFHVSKLPRNNSSVDKFYQRLRNVGSKKGLNVQMVPKKINLADEYLAWEHERYSIRKIYGFTLSGHKSAKISKRRSILDLNTGSKDRVRNLTRNVQVIAEALMNHVFQLAPDFDDVSESSSGIINKNSQSSEMPSTSLFSDLQVDSNFIQSSFDMLSKYPRSMQNMTSSSYLSSKVTNQQQQGDGANANGPTTSGPAPKHDLLNDLFSLVNHFSNDAAYYAPIKLDKRDPEFVLYGATVDKLFAYRIKPAVFDLILALIIVGYLGLIYLFILNASYLQYKIQLQYYWTNGNNEPNGFLHSKKRM